MDSDSEASPTKLWWNTQNYVNIDSTPAEVSTQTYSWTQDGPRRRLTLLQLSKKGRRQRRRTRGSAPVLQGFVNPRKS